MAGGVRGRVALVTGASRGIGFAVAELFREGGATVITVARTPPPPPPPPPPQQDDGAAQHQNHHVTADLSTPEGCEHAVDETLRLGGCDRIDILVCNHGIGSAAERPLHEMTTETAVELFRKSMATNLEGPFHLTRLVLPHMVARNYGRCVYVSSTAATDAGAEFGAVGYNTSKTALLGLMRSACRDAGRFNVTSNAVLPGWVLTEMADRSAEVEAQERGLGCTAADIWKERAALYPPKRVVTPDEVAQTILWLASEESSGVSGESIRVSLGCPI